MKFYSYKDIKQHCDCTDIARTIGLNITDGRCAATWRNGDNKTAVSINRDGWHDFVTEESGSAIDLVALVQFGGNRQQAQEWLGDYLGLTPVIDKLAPNPTSKSRYDELREDGYTEKKVYTYVDETGAPAHHVIRMEHPEKPKEFVQRAVDGKWSIKHIRTVLYNLPAIIASDWVVIVEGEKDADSLIRLGLPATTNAMGASKWKPEYSEFLRGKDVVILPDNDEPGRRHADLIAGHIAGIAKTIRVITISQLPKGDVTDWLEQEGGSNDRLLETISKSRPIDIRTINETFQLAQAKESNKIPFRNYRIDVEDDGVKKKIKQTPRHINEMIQDIFTRFLGFPRKVGDEIFDSDRDTGEIVYLRNTQKLFGWIERKSKQKIEWARGIGMTSMDIFFEGLKAEAPKYEAISFVPDFPRRNDVYYHHAPLIDPSPGHKCFEQLVDFFVPISPEYRVLIKAFFAAPLYYEPYISRPMWIIDSETPGAGKSSLATRVSLLYGHPAIEIKTRDFARDMQEVTKRLVSAEGRQARMLLIDNVVGTFASEELSSMVTMPYITGRPPYGYGEECRPNNLTYVITANNASIDNDLAIRSFFIRLKTLSEYRDTWTRELSDYITRNRIQIFSDIIDMLSNPPIISERPFTRFPEFEVLVLRAMCQDEAQYIKTIEKITESRASANIEEEWGRTIEDFISAKLSELRISVETSVFIRSQVVEEWVKKSIPMAKNPVQLARNLARSGHCKNIHPSIQIYPDHSIQKRRGILWIGSSGDKKPIIAIGKTDEKVEIIHLDMREVENQ